MTLVAGVKLFDGALLLADCRGSYAPPRGPDDRLQKVFRLLPHSAIGMAGSAAIAGPLLEKLLRQWDYCWRRRDSPRHLQAWMRRYLPTEYEQTKSAAPPAQQGLEVIVASVTGLRRDLPLHKTLLYTMCSPHFEPQETRGDIGVTAIGTGRPLVADIDVQRLLERFATPAAADPFLQAEQFRSLFRYQDTAAVHVGGLMPVLKIGRNSPYHPVSVHGYGHTHTFRNPDLEVALLYDPHSDRWWQRNNSTGRTRTLDWPWEPPPAEAAGRFDDLDTELRERRAALQDGTEGPADPSRPPKVAWHTVSEVPGGPVRAWVGVMPRKPSLD